MNRADVEMLNSSISGVGQALRERRQEQQKEQHDTEMELIQRQVASASADRQSRGLDIEKRRLENEESAAAKAEHAAELKGAFQDLADTTKRIQTGMANLGQAVRAGKMKPEDATGYFQDAVDSLPDQVKSKMLTDPSMKAAYDGQIPWEQIGAQPDKSPKPFSQKTPGGYTMEGIFDPATGHFQTTPQPDVTEETPAAAGSPTVPAVPGGMFSSGTPAIPAVPATPKRIVRHAPLTPAVPPMPSGVTPPQTAAPTATVGTFKDGTGKRWKYVGSNPNPTQDTNPSNWQQVP